MAVQSYVNIRSGIAPNESGQSNRTQDINRALPSGREVSAVVERVTQNPTRPGQFNITLQLGNQSFDVTSSKPLPQGAQVIVNRDSQGAVQLRLAGLAGADSNSQPSSPQQAAVQAKANAEGFLLRIANGSITLAQSLPVDQSVRGVVLSQTTANTPVATAQAPIPNTTTNAVTTQSNSAPVSTSPATQPASTQTTAPANTVSNTTTAVTNTTNAATQNLSGSAQVIASQANSTALSQAVSALNGNLNTSTVSPSSGLLSTTISRLTNNTTAAMPNPSLINTSQANAGSGTSTTTNAAATTNSPQNPSTLSSNPQSTSATNSPAATNTPTAPNTPLGSNNSALGSNNTSSLVQQAGAANTQALMNALNTSPPSASINQSTPALQNSSPLATSTAGSSLAALTSSSGSTSQPATQSAPTNTGQQTSQAQPTTTPSSARTEGFPVRVLVGSDILNLVAPRPIQSGQQVDLTRNEQGLIRLQFTPTPLPLAQRPEISGVIQQALKDALPVQIPFADGLNQLLQISQRQNAQKHSALNQLIESMMRLFSVKPGDAGADKAIARNLQQGGLLTESKLSQGRTENTPDLKQQLGQLAKVAEQLPPQAREQLSQLINALFARSTAQQVSSLQRWKDLPDGGQEKHYRLDVPIQQENRLDNAELRITEHRRRNEQGEFITLWTVKLHFELENYGGLDAEISLENQFELKANFWVERPETLDILRGKLSDFETELKQKGFDVAPLNARLGKLLNPEISPLQKRLVDLHT